MQLSTLIDSLVSSELAQLSIGTAKAEDITDANLAALVGHVNLGLMALYSRFKLKEGKLLVPLQDGVLQYPLAAEDLLKVESVKTDAGVPFPLNDKGNPFSLHTPRVKLLNVPEVVVKQEASLPDGYKTTALTVEYRAAHAQLEVEQVVNSGADTVELELPGVYMQALMYFVASRAHNPAGMSNEFHAGNTWYAKYEGECMRLKMENYEIDQAATINRKAAKGFP
jgi:hypothetical protein